MEEYFAKSKREVEDLIDAFYKEHVPYPCDPALKQVLLMQFENWGRMEIGVANKYLLIYKTDV
jgi:hypothetical protein